MALMTDEQYVESIRKLNIRVYMFDKKIGNPVDDLILRPSLNGVRMTCDLAQKPEYQGLVTAIFPYTGQQVNRFTHIHQPTEDLVKRVRMQRLLGQQIVVCFQRCVGMDAFSTVFSTTYETDQKYGTHYHENFTKFATYVRGNDLTVDGTITDPKDDRSKAPHEWTYPDLFLHTVEHRPSNIVARGAKIHQTDILNSHKITIIPTQFMKAEGEGHAMSFAVPMDTDGIFMIIGRQSCDTRKLKGGEMGVNNSGFGGVEASVVFNDVFIPNGRIFMCDEYNSADMLMERFVDYHRQNYGGCEVGVDDMLIGTAAVAADYSGTARASHIKGKLIEMTRLSETLYYCSIACSAEDHPTESGNCIIGLLLANVCKQNATRFPYEIVRLAGDIAGGLVIAASSETDLRDPRLSPVIDKYLHGVATVSTEDRLRILWPIENLALGIAAVGYYTESMHDAGSPQAQCIMVAHQGNLEHKKELARTIAHIKE